MTPCHVYIGEGSAEGEVEEWMSMLRARGIKGYDVESLEELPAVMGEGHYEELVTIVKGFLGPRFYIFMDYYYCHAMGFFCFRIMVGRDKSTRTNDHYNAGSGEDCTTSSSLD